MSKRYSTDPEMNAALAEDAAKLEAMGLGPILTLDEIEDLEQLLDRDDMPNKEPST